MSTVIAFSPSSSRIFQFSPVLDGRTYQAYCPFNNYAQRYYLSIYDNTGILKLSTPLIGSSDDFDISLTKGYFSTPIIYRISSGNLIIG